MKIYTSEECPQGSAAWHRIRALNFTASALGTFALEPIKFSLNVDEMKSKLDDLGISRKGVTKKDDLINLLPWPEDYMELCQGAKTAIIAQIKSERMQAMRDRVAKAIESGEPLQMTQEEDILLTRDEELASKEEKQFGYNIPVKYGKLLEPFARAYYEDLTGFQVSEVGFIEHGDGTSGFGCSPDGLIATSEDPSTNFFKWRHGLEIKCPIPETHIAWLIDGVLPSEHKIQVETCLAVSGLDRWDFISYCPGESPLLVTTYRSDFTNQLVAGIKTLVAEKTKMKAKLAKLWEDQYETR